MGIGGKNQKKEKNGDNNIEPELKKEMLKIYRCIESTCHHMHNFY